MQALRRNRVCKQKRNGAVTVELAMIVPVFFAITVATIESSRLYDTQNVLSMAAREGARYAAMDRSDLVAQGQSSNTKITNDILSFLEASGVDSTDVDVYIVNATDHTTPLDLDDPNNQLELFELRVELPFSSATAAAGATGDEAKLVAKVVFRNAPATLVQ